MGDISEEHADRFDDYCDGCGELMMRCVCDSDQSKCLCCDEVLADNQFGQYCWRCTSGVGWLQWYAVDDM